MPNKKVKTLEDTGERMIPEYHNGKLIYGEHTGRYLVAQPVVKNKVVLDIASGSGYGTKILSETAKKVFGVDVSPAAIEYAQIHYNTDNTEFILGDGESIPLVENSVDVVVTFETIEHIKNYKKFIKEIKRVLKPDGLAIISTPNDLEFAEGNHFHLHEFKYDELFKLAKEEFKNIDSYFQATWKAVGIGSEQVFQSNYLDKVPVLNYSPPSPEQYLYFYLVCSNREITEKIEPLLITAEHYSDRDLIATEISYQETVNQLLNKISSINNEKQEAEKRLAEVINSKAWKFANKTRHIKSIVTRNR